MSVTKEQIAAGIRVVGAVAEAIREAKEIPSGHLYSALMSTAGINMEQYESIIGTLCRTGLVKKDGMHVLHWTGPTFS